MAIFEYTAVNAEGKTEKGLMESDSKRQVSDALRKKKLIPLNIQSSLRKNNEKSDRGKIPSRQLAVITRQLATLVDANIPLEEALGTIANQCDKKEPKRIMSTVRSHVLSGHSLNEAFALFPRTFSNIFVATVAAGEKTGQLGAVLLRLANYSEKQQKVKQQLQQALTYPAITTLVSVGIVIFLLLYVVPQMVSVFKNMNQKLPMMTTILIDISHAVQVHWLALSVLLALTLVGLYYSRRNEKMDYRYHEWRLRIPLIGRFIQLSNTTRFIDTFSTLVGSSIPVVEAVTISMQLISNKKIKRSFSSVPDKIKEGVDIHTSLKNTHCFSSMTTNLIAAGEKSGKLSELLHQAAEYQTQELNHGLSVVLSLFEPAVIIVMGAVVLFIVMAVLLPIFSLDQLGGM